MWLAQRIGGRPPLDGGLGRLYDAIQNPRAGRNDLPLLRGDQLRAYMAEVRERALEVVDEVELDETEDPLLRGGFAYEMLIAHEHQHNETMLQLLQMIPGYELPDRDPSPAAEPVSGGPETVAVPGGSYAIGAGPPDSGFAYDNERPRHEVALGPFRIDRTPVTNGAFAEFIAETGADPPLFWERDGEGGWLDARFGRREPVDPRLPVIHVDAAEADAFARWAGKRLPTEAEWEAAAAGADRERANLGGRAGAPAPAGAYTDGAADCGAVQMLGDVWEWTASRFGPYPGFEAFPYPEYSEAHFGGDHRVLRGGSWATGRDVIRPSFRNWDHPIRRQIFAGFRCAEDG